MTPKERKLAILKAVLPLFARKGFAETTTKDLAKAAGISEPLLYRYFSSKEALYEEILDYSCQSTDVLAKKKLENLEPSASTLVHLVYFLMRALVLGQPVGMIEWDTRHRLMLKSFLEDGLYARLAYKNRFAEFVSRMAASLAAATAAGEAVASPISENNRACFAHSVGVWLAVVHLSGKPPMDFKARPEELLDQAVRFALRGMGMTDKAIATHYNPKALALSFGAA